MHEALLSKGRVQGSEYREYINCRYNCVLLCSRCHHSIQGTGGPEVVEELAWYLIGHWGLRQVRAWLEQAAKVYKRAGEDALNQFNGIFQFGKMEIGNGHPD